MDKVLIVLGLWVLASISATIGYAAHAILSKAGDEYERTEAGKEK